MSRVRSPVRPIFSLPTRRCRELPLVYPSASTSKHRRGASSLTLVPAMVATFHHPISLSTPHIYISTRPFLPSQSPLSKIFCREFTRAIKIRVGHLLSWPTPPFKWTGHTGGVACVSYSPTGSRIVTGPTDKTIRIWDAESGAVVVGPLTHNGEVTSVAYSPGGRHIISGCWDQTIRMWDAETGAAVGNPLFEYKSLVSSVAFSPDGRHIISGFWGHAI
jgi:WD40 repeat protein